MQGKSISPSFFRNFPGIPPLLQIEPGPLNAAGNDFTAPEPTTTVPPVMVSRTHEDM